MDQRLLTETREYVWKYFIAFAEARLTTFRFYLAFCTILITGIAVVIGTPERWLGSYLALLLSFLSFIYWKVDIRHKDLVSHAERALEFLEKNLDLPEELKQPHVLQLFYSEAERSNTYRRFPHHFSPQAHFSYATCVNMVFVVFGFGGIITAILLAVN
jgi:hypothetical protein